MVSVAFHEEERGEEGGTLGRGYCEEGCGCRGLRVRYLLSLGFSSSPPRAAVRQTLCGGDRGL